MSRILRLALSRERPRMLGGLERPHVVLTVSAGQDQELKRSVQKVMHPQRTRGWWLSGGESGFPSVSLISRQLRGAYIIFFLFAAYVSPEFVF